MEQEICCPKFDPIPWNEKKIVWDKKTFIKDRVFCLFHIPINFGSKMIKNVKIMESSQAVPEMSEFIVLSNNETLWGMDIYIKTKQEIPNANNVTISGSFLSKVFEGEYRNIPKWIEEMKIYVSSKGTEIKDLFFYYTTCPKCAKKYGNNYVVLLAKIE